MNAHVVTVHVLAALALLGASLATGPARAEENDLRGLRVGMALDELPATGYAGFACESGPALQGWRDYRRCAPDAAGLRAVRFRYDEGENFRGSVNDTYEGTKVGGHPVLLALLLDDAGTVRGLRIESDPAARLFFRKKAHLLAELAKARFGEDGWTCTQMQPSADEEPVGGVFVKEHCEKVTLTRRYLLDRALLRRPGEELRGFTSRSRVEILAPG